ncbi:MAG: tRNA1(Val) (adenine(37)-N6)-methyltransferase [Clostridiales bacterium]|nr:tRNA1(Val) (adenine(37)-N6)-methyltransferase [Clostridiales bacterium]
MVELLENESIDDLQLNGLKLIQKKDGFRFGVDAVLLADFADVKKNDIVIDLGTGTGIIPVLLAAKKTPKHITGLEIQTDMAEMAARTIKMNDLEEKIDIVCGDIRKAVEKFGNASFSCVVSNPPYMNSGGGLVNPSDSKAIARHELLCSLEDVISTSSRLLCPAGRFAMVHRPERLVDIICLMRKYSLEPKYLRFVHPAPYKKPAMILIRGTKNGNAQLKVLEPLYVHDEAGKYSAEINRIYGRTHL